jgi:translocator protein
MTPNPRMRIANAAPRGQWSAFVLITLGVIAMAGIGTLASLSAKEFYAVLAKPAWAPPAGVFGPVWTLLYLLMAIAACMVWRARGSFRAAALPLGVFAAQLVLNALWSWLFFRWHRGALAVVEVSLLWLLILATVLQFWQVKKLAGALLIPYLLWVSFATALTAAVWRLNPTFL